MTEHAGVVRITTFTTDDARRDRLVESLQQMCEDARNAEGCFGAQVCSVEFRPEAVAVVSRWRSGRSVDVYLAAHGEEVRSGVKELVTTPPETVHLTSLSGR